MIARWLAVVGFSVLCWGCYGEKEDTMLPNLHTNLLKSQISDMFTTGSPLGSFVGPQQPNLQIDYLQPGEYTLQFQVIEPPLDSLPYSTYAIVRWKIKGQQIQRIISIFSGAVLGGVAEAVDVQILDQSNRSATGHISILQAILVNGSPFVTLAGLGGPINIPGKELLYFASQPDVGYPLLAPVVNAVPGTVIQLAIPFSGPSTPPLPPPGTTPFWPQSPYKIGVALSKGTRPPIMQPPVLLTTENAITIAPASLGPVGGIAIPRDAGVISIITSIRPQLAPLVSLVNAAEGYVQFAAPGPALRHAYIPGTPQNFYPVPPGSEFVFFGNSSAAVTLDFTFQWGIEG